MPSSSNNITFGRTALPGTQWNGDVSALLDLLVGHLTGTLDSGYFIGQVGGTEPVTDIGLWLNGNTFYKWSSTDSKYLPLPLVTGGLTGGVVYTTQLINTANQGNVSLFLPSKNGATLATVADVVTPAPTNSATGTAINIDWSTLGNHGLLYINATGNITLAETSSPNDGQRIDLWIEQALAASGALTVTWPANWVIQTGGPVLQTRSSATVRYIDHFTVRKVGNNTFVEQGKTFQIGTASGAGSDTVAPTVSDITVPVSTKGITLTWNESLQGGALDATKWSVKRNGVTNAVVSASATGNRVVLVVTTAYASTNTGTVAYTGTDVKDLAGNTAATFTATALSVDVSGTSDGSSDSPSRGGLVP